MSEIKLTYGQLTTVVSRFRTSCHVLSWGDDYPERKRDKVILDILISMKCDVMKEEEEGR